MKTMPVEHYPGLSELIGDLPQDVIESHSLIQEHATVYYQGEAEDPGCLMILTPYEPGEATCYGSNLDGIVDFSEVVGDLEGFVVEPAKRDDFISRYKQKYGKTLTVSFT